MKGAAARAEWVAIAAAAVVLSLFIWGLAEGTSHLARWHRGWGGVLHELLQDSAWMPLLFGFWWVKVSVEDWLNGAESVLKAAPAWLLVAVGTVVPALEALVWCTAFVEGAQVIAKRPAWGALLGAVAYGVVYHHGYDTRTILEATWVAAVINFSHLRVRTRSRTRALMWAVALRWVFVSFAMLS